MSRLFGILVTYRRPAALDAALAALSDPRHGLARLVVVDNAAADETPAILDRHPGLATTLVASPENLGPAGGIALGMQAVAAEANDDDWVVLLDDDNVNPGELALADLHAVAVAARSVDPAVAMVGAVGGRLDRRRGRLVRPADAELAAELVPVDFVAGGQFPVVSVAAIRRVGPFRADLFWGLEELEFGLRLTGAGCRVLAHGPTWLARRRRFGRTGEDVAPVARDPAPWRRYYAVRNLVVVLRSHGLRLAALRATADAVVGRPLADWRRRRPRRLLLARLTWRGAADAWLGRTGRRVDPDTPRFRSARDTLEWSDTTEAERIDHLHGGESTPLTGHGRDAGAVRVVYIAGHGRSGSTLLDLLLGRGAGWVSCGEVRHLWIAVRDGWHCACGEPLTSCPRWSAVVEKLAAEGVDLAQLDTSRRVLLRFRRVPGLVWPILLGAPRRAALYRLAEQTAALYRAIAAVTGAEVVVDSSKDPLYGLLLARSPGLDLTVVHLVRDPRAVAHSWLRRRPRPEIPGGKATMPTHPPLHTAFEWVLRNGVARVLGRVASRYRLVRYEDLVADPDATLAAIAPDRRAPTPTDPARDGNHTVGGNPMRFLSGPLVVRPDEEWRRALAPGARRLVTICTWPLMRRFGYRP